MSNTKSMDFERGSTQYLSIVDANLSSGFPGKETTGSNGDITIEMWIKLEELPSTAGVKFGLVDKFQSVGNQRSYAWEIDTANKFRFLYSEDGTIAERTDTLTDSAVFDGDDVGAWVHIAATVDVSAASIIFYKKSNIGKSYVKATFVNMQLYTFTTYIEK